MYNLSVAVAQTYYVGEGQWLVHNQNKELSKRELQKAVESIKNGGTYNVKTVEEARQIIRALERQLGARPLPTQFGMEDSIFKFPTYRGDLVGYEFDSNGRPIGIGDKIHPIGQHRELPHYNIKFPKNMGGNDGTILITGGC